MANVLDGNKHYVVRFAKRSYLISLGLLSALLLLTAVPAGAAEDQEQPPSAEASSAERPSAILKDQARRKPPQLPSKGRIASEDAKEFINWAAASPKADDNLVRRKMVDARNNPDVIATLCDEAFTSQSVNHSQALVTLGLLGEAKSPYSEECLARFVAQPLPEKGTVIDGEILEQTALATLQAKAIDGLAYLNTESASRIVLDAVANHSSRIVRAEAIAAYLFNQNYSEQAKDMLRAFVRPDERVSSTDRFYKAGRRVSLSIASWATI